MIGVILAILLLFIILCIIYYYANVNIVCVGSKCPGDGHKANALVLSCIDFRFIGATVDYLYGRNNKADFDYFVLAGASLGYNESFQGIETPNIPEKSPDSWYESYEDHIDIAIELHDIKEIIVIDHMDCGYYHAIYGNEINTPEKERIKHEFNIHKFIETLKNNSKYTFLNYTGILLDVDKNGTRFDILYEEITDDKGDIVVVE